MQKNKLVLIVGLGNPGNEYKNTRHNVGFMSIDFLAPTDATWKKEKNAMTARVDIDGLNAILVKPQTYMNNSGEAVGALMAFYKIPLENVVVIHDDMDLKLGDMRTKVGGGSAGHNGIKSIDANVGREYTRIRIGIDHPRNLGLPIDAADWVLGRFTDDQLEIIKKTLNDIKLVG
mgnify:CR=1 FL=1